MSEAQHPNSLIVCKFGGTSLASASQILKCRDIVLADSNRTYVVPSAPGKRTPDDQKITDLLLLCHSHASQNLPFSEIFTLIRERFNEIVAELGLDLDLGPALDETEVQIKVIGQAGGSAEYAASRGEAINGRIMAALLGFDYVDAADVIRFHNDGTLYSAATYALCQKKLAGRKAVIPGFYGATEDGTICTFSRGGSDVTGAIVARALEVASYENWTDVHGLLITDPRIVEGAYTIETITYQELRELSYSGASVLHEDAVFPVREAHIPVRIRNTNDPQHPGTLIVPRDHEFAKSSYDITGIAGRKDFTVIMVEKAMMNSQLGFGRRVLAVLEDNGISFEHMPSGIDTLSVVISDDYFPGSKLDKVVEEIKLAVHADRVTVDTNLALIATVGRGMAHTPGLSAKLFGALGDAGVNIRMIDQGSSELNIITGVSTDQYETAIRAIYNAFIHDGVTVHPVKHLG